MDPAKVKAVKDWPAPKNTNELQRFIGFANFYRRFIDQFSKTTRPLHDLTKLNKPYVWSSACESSFEKLKTAFTSAPILKIADPYRPFILECDCSDFALGAILSQRSDDDGEIHPVAYLSRSLVQAERNYEIFDKELLAIVASFKEWRHYLEGNPNRLEVIVYTDHRNLETFMTTKQLTRRQARWAETLGCFDFVIKFRPGRKSDKPDALSRRPDLKPSEAERLTFGQLLKPENIGPDTFTTDSADIDSFFLDESIDLEDAEKWFEIDVMGCSDIEVEPEETNGVLSDIKILELIREANPTDERITNLMESVTNPISTNMKKLTRMYEVKDGILYRHGKVEVPNNDNIKFNILRSRHDTLLAGHPGRNKTLSLTKRCFTWPSQKAYVNQYVDGCDSCLRIKSSTQKPFGTLQPLPIPAGPWTDISYDLITKLPTSNGYDSILTVVDRLTKMAHFIPCKETMKAEDLADLMINNVWKLHGTPKSIVSDRGSIFVSKITQQLDRRLGIKL